MGRCFRRFDDGESLVQPRTDLEAELVVERGAGRGEFAGDLIEVVHALG
jgi:hypothetical protein